MARLKIKRMKRAAAAHVAAVRTAFAALIVLISVGAFQTFADASTPFLARGAVVSIALDPPKPYDPASDPSQWLTAASTPVIVPGTSVNGAPTTNPAGTATPFVAMATDAFSPGVAAAPYIFRGRTSTDALRASLCLTAAIYYEAANEPDDGQRAVAQVVLNRVRHPAWPDTVCDVVYQGTERPGTLCQFTFGCDGALARVPSTAGWIRARRVAQAALAGYVYAPAGLATHYHTLAVSPAWGKSLTPVGIYGAHIFYRLPGGAGALRAFSDNYRGNEPLPAPRPKIGVPAIMQYDMATAQTASGNAGTDVSDAPTRLESPMAIARPVPAPPSVATDRRYVPGSLPDSDVREEYRNSGSWIVR